MRFVTVRELRGKSAAIWRELSEHGELVVTSNGKPVAILSGVSEDSVEESLQAIRRARAVTAVQRIQERAVAAGRGSMDLAEIDAEISAVRERRSR
jgi:antitoxin (DNA-binding transcriptional repressor) of toxin-antitoxin stability system